MPLQATSGAATYDAYGGGVPFVPTYIEDVFSTWLYTGNGSTQTITNGIDLAGQGGLVWQKVRGTAGYDHVLTDTTTSGTGSLTNYLSSNTTNSFSSNQGNIIGSYNSNGFTLNSGSGINNVNGTTNVSWTFRKQPKFFDIVTYTGNGGTQNISHSLNSVPGMIWVKRTNASSNWVCYHRSLPSGYILYPNDIAAQDNFGTIPQGTFGNNSSPVAPTSTQFTIGNQATVNASGGTYVAYLFAHNAGGFGLTGTDNVISCGSFTASSAVTDINLGYEPQWILIKRSDSAAGPVGWYIYDSMRGMLVDLGTSSGLRADTTSAEAVTGSFGPAPTATGFQYLDALTTPATFIYMAIRRGPMKTPTSGTSVFSPIIYTGNGSTGQTLTTNFVVDKTIFSNRTKTNSSNTVVFDRLRGNTPYISTNTTDAESTLSSTISPLFDNNTGIKLQGATAINANLGSFVAWNLRRAPGFFDEVCYTATGSGGLALTHNLGVVPEMMIVKGRSGASNWPVYHVGMDASPQDFYQILDGTGAKTNAVANWNNTMPTATQFTVGGNNNASGYTYVAYLFATLAGISKVGSYTGTGATQTINAGLPTGARFILIKRTDSTGSWWVWDTARGMVSGTDPRLALNSTAAETNANWVYTTTNGFQIVTSDATVNASGGSYIYLAVS